MSSSQFPDSNLPLSFKLKISKMTLEMNYWQVFVFFGAMWTKMCFMYSYLSTFISDRLITILSNNEWTETSFFEHWTTQTCSFIGDRTRTPYFWLRTVEHQTSNIVRPITRSSKVCIGVSLGWAFKYRTTMWQVIAKSIQTFFEMRILHTFFNVDQERAWNVYVWLWYEKN